MVCCDCSSTCIYIEQEQLKSPLFYDERKKGEGGHKDSDSD